MKVDKDCSPLVEHPEMEISVWPKYMTRVTLSSQPRSDQAAKPI